MTIKLLVADDSVTQQKMIRLAFNDEDVIIESASSGNVALEVARDFKPDVVLADVVMPGYNGYEVCERIKENPEFAHTPVILLVGTFEPFDELEAIRVKCDGHITKPFDTAELIQMVQSLAEKKMMSQKNETSVEPAKEPLLITNPAPSGLKELNMKEHVEPHVWESFVGSNQILELFDAETVALARTLSFTGNDPNAAEPAPEPVEAAPPEPPTDDFLNQVVDQVVRRMTPDVIRDVAWEVVPELSEVLIRRVIEEQQKP
jgi:CheY-like chemotaxis protein